MIATNVGVNVLVYADLKGMHPVVLAYTDLF
jgi:hypothetical protein